MNFTKSRSLLSLIGKGSVFMCLAESEREGASERLRGRESVRVREAVSERDKERE